MNIVNIPNANLVSLKAEWKKESITGCISDYCKPLQEITKGIIDHFNVPVSDVCCTNVNIIQDNIVSYNEELDNPFIQLDLEDLNNHDIKYSCEKSYIDSRKNCSSL